MTHLSSSLVKTGTESIIGAHFIFSFSDLLSYILIYLSFRRGMASLKHLFYILSCMMWIPSGHSLRPQPSALLTILGPLNSCHLWACTVLDFPSCSPNSLPLTPHVSAYFLLPGRHISLASLPARYPSQHRTLEISHERACVVVWTPPNSPTRLHSPWGQWFLLTVYP